MLLRNLLAVLASSALLLGQTRPGDDVTFDTPAGYKTTTRADSTELVRIDQQRKFYCQMGIYSSQPSQGSTAKDLDTEWKAVVVNQFKVRGDIVTKDLPLPWAPGSAVRGAPTTSRDGNPVISTLFVLRFPNNRYVGVLFNVPNESAFESCQQDAMQLVMSVRMKAGAVPSSAPPAAQSSSRQGAAPGISGPPGNVASGSVVGVWERVIASQPAGRYNMFTKQWEYDPVAALSQFKQTRRFYFDAQGRYHFELDAEDYSRNERSRVVERGRYTIQNGAIHFQPEAMQDGRSPRGQNVTLSARPVPAAHTRRFLLGEHPQFRNSVGLQLQTGDGGWETYSPPK